MEWCEECQDYRQDAYRRPEMGGRTLCNDHYYKALRRRSPTGLWRRPAWATEEETWLKRKDVPSAGRG